MFRSDDYLLHVRKHSLFYHMIQDTSVPIFRQLSERLEAQKPHESTPLNFDR